MKQLSRFLADMSLSDPLVWVALGAGFAVVFVFMLLGRRQRRTTTVGVSAPPPPPKQDDAPPPPKQEPRNAADVWLPTATKPNERRRTLRRGGVPTAIHMVDPQDPKKILEGFVLDRSSGGLRIAVEKPYPTGSAVQIRPTNAHAQSPWVTVIVRNCKETGDYFEIGCQFQEKLPWHILLMFG